MICFYFCLAFKDESGTATISTNPLTNTITGSLIDLKPSSITSPGRTEPLHHRPYRKATNKSTLNKTDEHCRSLFNLLPTSLRSRHQHQQTSNSRGIDAVSMQQTNDSTRQNKRRSRLHHHLISNRKSDSAFLLISRVWWARSNSLATNDRTNWLFFLFWLYAIYNSNHEKAIEKETFMM